MKTAILSKPEPDKAQIYSDKLLASSTHGGCAPQACEPYQAKTERKVARPFRTIRANCFMTRPFVDFPNMSRPQRRWLDTVANLWVAPRLRSEDFLRSFRVS